jgi:hypothetical protein
LAQEQAGVTPSHDVPPVGPDAEGDPTAASAAAASPTAESAPTELPSDQPSERRRGTDYFGRFTASARKSLALAKEAARRLEHDQIRPEHLLIGLIDEGTGLACHILVRLGFKLEQLRADMEQRLGRGSGSPASSLSLSPTCQQVVTLAVEESRRLDHKHLGTEHLLVGLFREGSALDPTRLTDQSLDSLIMLSFSSRGVGLPAARFGRGAPPGARKLASDKRTREAARDNVLSIRVSNGDLSAVDALVEIGVARSRSEAAAWLLSSGVTANQSLFERAQGVIDEVRRLREEAQQLVAEHTREQTS